ncbi:MAG: porin [Hydrogenophaga sp.]|nr:porin [Hydrogenophaga sp.]
MKKSLIALAVLASSGAAMAQSSVTVYGRLDASVGSAKVGAPGAALRANTQMFNSNMTSSRLGFRGTEDLGGGLKAIFGLESNIAVDAPSATTLGDRAAFAGLSGGFGTIKLGRHDTSFDDIRDLMVSSNLWDSSHLASTETIVGAGANGAVPASAGVGQLADYGDRANNQIRYESPSFGGFSAGVSYAFDEQVAPIKQDITAFNLRYKAGNLDVGYAYQENKNAAVAASNLEYNTVAAAYNFGTFRVSGGWNQVKNKAARKSDTYTVGVNVPVNAFDFSLGYSTAKAKQTGATFEKGDAFSAGVTYALSKRTRLYAALTNGDIENAAGAKVLQRDIYAVGVRHEF